MKNDEVQSEFNGYVDGVLSGRIITGKLVRKACERHRRDIEHGEARGLFFDWAAAARAVRFFGLLCHGKGKHSGKPFKLSPWQTFIVGSLFGWKWRATGCRRFRTSYTEIARKAGKSTLAAGIGLYCLTADGEEGAEVFALATKRDQAKIVYAEAARMRRKSPKLRAILKQRVGGIYHEKSNSKFEPLGRDSDSLDGLNVSCAIIDELHAHKHRELLEVIDTSTGARTQPLLFTITTAGSRREGICYEERTRSENVLNQTAEDDTHFCFIACVDDGDDVFNEQNWKKANPNLGVSVEIDQVRALAKAAQNTPTKRPAFSRYMCGVWCETSVRWIDADKWLACRAEFTADDLKGRACLAGIDLAGTRDLSACVLLFPDDDRGRARHQRLGARGSQTRKEGAGTRRRASCASAQVRRSGAQIPRDSTAAGGGAAHRIRGATATKGRCRSRAEESGIPSRARHSAARLSRAIGGRQWQRWRFRARRHKRYSRRCRTCHRQDQRRQC